MNKKMNKNIKKNVNKNNKKSGMSGGKMVAVGAGLAAIGAGAYYLMGPNAKMHQKKASALLAKMKKEVGDEIKKVKTASAPMYDKVVEMVSENYAKQYKVHGKDIKAFAKKMKDEWKGVNKIVKKATKVAKKKV